MYGFGSIRRRARRARDRGRSLSEENNPLETPRSLLRVSKMANNRGTETSSLLVGSRSGFSLDTPPIRIPAVVRTRTCARQCRTLPSIGGYCVWLDGSTDFQRIPRPERVPRVWSSSDLTRRQRRTYNTLLARPPRRDEYTRNFHDKLIRARNFQRCR